MTMEIYTYQLAQWRTVMAKGIELVDITAKSGFSWFAPTYENVMLFKDGQLSEEEYTALYIAKMRESFRSHHHAWEQLKTKDRVAYGCYCRYPGFCHRHIIVDLLCKYLDSENVMYRTMGEIR